MKCAMFFSKAMGGLGKISLLEPTGAGCRSLTTPSKSSSFSWTEQQVAKLGNNKQSIPSTQPKVIYTVRAPMIFQYKINTVNWTVLLLVGAPPSYGHRKLPPVMIEPWLQCKKRATVLKWDVVSRYSNTTEWTARRRFIPVALYNGEFRNCQWVREK